MCVHFSLRDVPASKMSWGGGAQGTTASCELGYSLYWVAGRTDPKHLHLDKGK